MVSVNFYPEWKRQRILASLAVGFLGVFAITMAAYRQVVHAHTK
jgi:hypothetical protein